MNLKELSQWVKENGIEIEPARCPYCHGASGQQMLRDSLSAYRVACECGASGPLMPDLLGALKAWNSIPELFAEMKTCLRSGGEVFDDLQHLLSRTQRGASLRNGDLADRINDFISESEKLSATAHQPH